LARIVNARLIAQLLQQHGEALRNDAINRARGERRRTDHEQHAARLYQQRESKTDSSEDLQALTEALGNLVAADRELVTLRIWSELTWEQVGQLTNLSSSSAQRRYVAALKKIRKELETTCPTNPDPANSNCHRS